VEYKIIFAGTSGFQEMIYKFLQKENGRWKKLHNLKTRIL
jgi:hypothetical protein